MRPFLLLGLAVAAQIASSAPLAAQSGDSEARGWRLAGLRSCFCVQLLLDPASEVLQELPTGYTPVAASQAGNLHRSLRDVVEGQPEFASWSPSRLCFQAKCTNSLSVLPPRTCASRSANSRLSLPNAAISVGQTKVKSFGQKK